MLKIILRLFKFIASIFKRRVEKATAQFRDYRRQVRSKAPPLRIELITSTDTAWLNAPSAQTIVEFLVSAGFQSAGVVAIKGNDKAVNAGFAAPQQGVHACVSKVADQAFLSFSSHFADGSAFECTNKPVPFELPWPEWIVRHRHVGATPSELWALFLAARPTKATVEATADNFAASEADGYFRYQVWLAERGGLTREELVARYKAVGRLPSGDDAETRLNLALADEIERSLCNWWRLQADVPYPLDEIIEPLIIIHDELPPGLLTNTYWCGTNDTGAKDADFVVGTSREAFARVVASRGGLLRKIFEKPTPLAADFYLPK